MELRKFVFLGILLFAFKNCSTYKFMTLYEYQLGLVDNITEAAPQDKIMKECYLDGKDYLSNLTQQQKHRMCQEAIQLERFQINNFTLTENGVPGEVKKYKASFLIDHEPPDMIDFISLGFLCHTQPGPVYLQQGPAEDIIFVNSLKDVATTPAYDI